VRVGGDWYDAIDLDDGVMLVVGDVQGHDVQAAALMAQLRTVVRAAACEGHPPSLILARAADYLERLGSDRLATVVCVQLDVDAQLATVASAGHPAPLVLAAHPDGLHAEALQVDPGPPLGIGQHWNEHSTRLPSDAVLLLYTDGLVENRAWAIGEGLSRLVQLLRRVPSHADLPLILDAVVELMPAGQRQDDVAVLSARLPCSAARGDRVSRRLPSHPISVPVARAWIRGWLAGADLGDAAVEAVELVVSELVTNAVRESDDHLRVMIESQGDSVLIEVFDSGHRLPGLADPAVDSTSGRGLRLVASLADDWGTREELSGKTVWARVGVRVPVG
jgi:anti-sigma regulatory factor (Ser/Thr protein kinase)